MDRSRFQRYEENLINSLTIVDRELGVDAEESQHPDEFSDRRSYIQAKAELFEAEGYLHALEIEFRLMVSAEKSKLSCRLKSYREGYQTRFAKLQTVKREIGTSCEKKIEPVGSGPGPGRQTYPTNSGAVALDIEGRELRTNAALDRSTNSLEQSRQLIASSETIGKSAISDLEGQREQLLGAKSNISETKEYMISARQLLRSLGGKTFKLKISLALTITLLLIVIFLIIYFGLARKF